MASANMTYAAPYTLPTRKTKAMTQTQRPLKWLEAGDAFPPLESAWGEQDPAPGLLAANGTLDTATLLDAYSQGIFPWFNNAQPVLWWSPDPRMVLETKNFKLHRSLRQRIKHFRDTPGCEIRFDSAFERVIKACSTAPRAGQNGTWIVDSMLKAYIDLHKAGHAHSVETWVDGELIGGLYCINLGRMVFGESMFANQTDASKIALAALVAFCRANEVSMIDCQQNTAHLASLGGGEIGRAQFANHLQRNVCEASPRWDFQTLYWNQLLTA
jgi:leucyl/phenylalanyl-tRNA--protein transferase